MKALLGSFLLAASLSAQAQLVPFALGMAAGGSSSPGDGSPATIAVFSQNPNNDVILCARSPENTQATECEVGWGDYVSATEYAKRMGYSKIHRKGMVIHGRISFVVMEVSR